MRHATTTAPRAHKASAERVKHRKMYPQLTNRLVIWTSVCAALEVAVLLLTK